MELEFWCLRLTRHFSSSKLRLHNFDSWIYRSLNILILVALRERVLRCRAEVEKTRCVPEDEINQQQYWFTVNFTGRCDRRRCCLIAAYSGVRRLSEVSLE